MVTFSKYQTIAFFLAFVILAGCRFYFKKTTDQVTVIKNSTSVENGKNLAFNVCAGCHYDQHVNKFIGKSLNDLPKIAGHLYSANLTQSVTHGRPPQYSDAELFYLLKTGISKSGKFMPYMMRPMMADQDAYDIITFLRSGDPSVAPMDTTVGKTHINIIGRTGTRVLASPQPYIKGVQQPNVNDHVAYGRYLVALIGCFHCHSKKALTLNYLEPEKSKGYLQGGMKLKDPQGNRIYGPNLTPDKETGIGNFTREDFKMAITEGVAPDRKLGPSMPKFKHLTDNQVNALFDYLKSLPPVRHQVR